MCLILRLFVWLFVLCCLAGRCKGCDPGFYFDNEQCLQCANNCKACSSESSCTSCRIGYYGTTCSDVCPKHCHDNECHQASGLCLSCSKGYYNDDCKRCVQCPENCTTCNSLQSCFACKNGLKGKACEDACSDCLPGTRCDKNTGYCLESCREGFSGELCDTKCDSKCMSCSRLNQHLCLSCTRDRHGLSLCNKECPKSCLNQTCRDSDGVCIYGCLPGYLGETCNEKCCRISDTECFEDVPLRYRSRTTAEIVSIIVTVILVVCNIALIGYIVIMRRKLKFAQLGCCNIIAEQLRCLQNDSKPARTPPFPNPPSDSIEDTNVEDVDEGTKCLQPSELDKVNDDRKSSKIQLKDVQHHAQNSEPNEDKLQKENSSSKVGERDDVASSQNTSHFTKTIFVAKHPESLDYIALVGPTKAILSKLSAFWKTVWDERCNKIVMLSSLRDVKDVCRFDANLVCCARHDDITVICESGYNYAQYAVRTLTITRKTEDGTEQRRQVSLLRFFAWPSKWAPANISSFLEFHEMINPVKTELDGPTLIYSRQNIAEIKLIWF